MDGSEIPRRRNLFRKFLKPRLVRLFYVAALSLHLEKETKRVNSTAHRRAPNLRPSFPERGNQCLPQSYALINAHPT